MKTLLPFFLTLGQLCSQAFASSCSSPTAKTVNGTYRGLYLPGWDQEAFLGIPYAQPPLGNLRYRWPQSLNSSFTGVRDAVHYGNTCMQNKPSFNNTLSEDCLTLNVVKPAGNHANLPILVWIYGGGLYAGGTADPQYNLSGIVRVSQDIGEPIIAVSMDYRLNMYGFFQTPQLFAEGSSNAGFLDQRMALRWIQDNIAGFGGDPSKVVIWGESAGAQSIGYHLFSYGGRDDGLFRGAIMESGGPVGTPVVDLSYYAAPVENFTRSVGCFTAKDQLACLRGLSQQQLYAAFPTQSWNPIIDGDFLTGYPSQLMQTGNFVKVPLLIGTNTDEGTSFSISGISKPNTDQDIINDMMTWRNYALSPPNMLKLLELYPNDPCNEPPYYITNCSVFPSQGLMWRRASAIGGDMVMVSGRRKMCELYTTAGQAVYSFRFDTRPYGGNPLSGVSHGVNVAFSFQNISGLLGPSPQYDVNAAMSRAIGIAYVRWANNLDPNPPSNQKRFGTENVNATALPQWPQYDLSNPANMVLNASGPFVEADTYRNDGIAFFNTYEVARELLS